MPEWVAVLALLAAVGAAAGVAWQQRTLRALTARLDTFLRGKDGQSLEALLAAHGATINHHTRSVTDLTKATEYLHRALQSAVRKVAFERYNPFPGLGGNQSFTLVLLDAHNSGVVMTSLHNREGTRIYAKAIRDGTPLQQLSDEEARSLQNAVLQQGA